MKYTMTDKKLTDSEIVKDLPKVLYGGHGCKNCKYDNGKGDDRCGLKGCKIARYAIDLIKRQQAEIERLTDKCESVFLCNDEVIGQAKTLARAEAVKEFAKKLQCGVPKETGVIRCSDVDNLVKEMTQEY